MKRLALIITSFLFLLVSCQDKEAKEELEKYRDQASLEKKNINLVRTLFEEINNNRNLQVYDELCTPDYRFYSPSTNPDPLSLEEVKSFAEMVLKAFPDANYIVKEIFADRDHVIVWNVFNGTHQAEYQGILASGNKIQVSSILIFRIQNGKIIEEREEADMLGALLQMGTELQMPE
jgi:predicted ester cyclase